MAGTIGNVGFFLTASGALVLSILFLTLTVWWETWLGRILAAFFTIVTVIFGFIAVRLAGVEIPNVSMVRAVLYLALGFIFWGMVGGFIWAQFFARNAPRRRCRGRRRSDG
jgi:hypothetical protein